MTLKNLKFIFVISIYALILNITFLVSPAKASEPDGVIDQTVGTSGYREIANSYDASSQVLRYKSGVYTKLLVFGSKSKNQSGSSCDDYAATPTLKLLSETGTVESATYGNELLTYLNPTSNKRALFTAAVQDSNGVVFLAGLTSDVSQTNTDAGFSCSYPNPSYFLARINPDGSVNKFGSNNTKTLDYGYITSILPIDNGKLVLTTLESSGPDVIFLDATSGELETTLGESGTVDLVDSTFRIFKSVLTSEGIVLMGDVSNDSDDWWSRWAITELTLQGIETQRFKGNYDYQYSSGKKEGIFWNPVSKGNFIYVIGGILDGSTYDIRAIRVSKSGALDTNYGGNLRSQLVAIGIDPCSYCSGDFAIDSYGRALLTITTNSTDENGSRKTALVRLKSNGSVDETFGSGGKIWVQFDYQAGVYSLSESTYAIYGNRNNSAYCSDGVCGLYKDFFAKFSSLPPTPIINSISEEDGYLRVNVALEQVFGTPGNWFYQVRTSDNSCINPYGESGTWDTTYLIPEFQIGKSDDNPSDGYDLTVPLTNGCNYTIKVAHWNEIVGNYVSTIAIPGRPFINTLAASSITSTEAALNADVNAKGFDTQISFCIGTNSDLSGCSLRSATTNSRLSNNSNTPANYRATGLAPGTTYYFRGIAANDTVTALGSIRSFTTVDEATQKARDEAARAEAERIKAEEAARQAEIVRTNAKSEILNLTSTGKLDASTLKSAGVISAVPEIIDLVNEYIKSLDALQRQDMNLIESRAKELKESFFLEKLNDSVEVRTLQELGFTGVTNKLLPELQIALKELGVVDKAEFMTIQKEINKLNTIFSGRENGTLSILQINSLGIQLALPNKAGQVLLKFRNQPLDVFKSIETISAKLAEIEKVIIDRLNKTASGRAKTEELLKKIQTRKKS